MLDQQDAFGQTLLRLAENRPLFHSEADFQHALAWQLHQDYPQCQVRLEVPFRANSAAEYLDLLVWTDTVRIAVELKYKTRKTEVEWKGEQYRLAGHDAQDHGRHDFLKDVARIERFVLAGHADVGYAVLLTNDSSYWAAPRHDETNDAGFRLSHGRVVRGELTWGPRSGKGTTAGREAPIQLTASYTLSWADYCDGTDPGARGFKYLVVRIGS